mmetsp:Transcript_9474/g.20872  ORF Transcript_9474/g.20872 Transcript_9474/m.20872 type:complete len:262 (-) Transcript_9474:1130-1915(-)
MDGDDLVVLGCQVVPILLQVGNLHEEPRNQSLPDVGIILLVLEGGRHQGQPQPLHNPLQLVPDILRRLQAPPVHKIILAEELRVGSRQAMGLICVEDVEQAEVVPIHVGELGLRLVRLLLRLLGPQEDHRHTQQRHDGQGLIGAIVLGRRNEHLGKLGIKGQLRHQGTIVSQLPLVVQGANVIQQLQRSHQRLRRRRVHEIKVHQVIHPQLLQRQHHRPQIRSQNLGEGGVLQLTLEGLLGVEPEALPRPGPPGAPGALLG